MRLLLSICCGLLLVPKSTFAQNHAPGSIDQIVADVADVGKEGEGNAEAAEAVAKLQTKGPDALMPILRGIDGANPLAQNWLSGAFESIACRALAAKEPLPVDELLQVVKEKRYSPVARTIAWNHVIKVRPELQSQMVPGFLTDPNPYLRRLAVAHYIDAAKDASAEDRTSLWKKALSGAVDVDQVNQIVEALGKNGVQVTLNEHFGFLTQFHIIGPFDNKDKAGFTPQYAPEKEIDLTAEYEGQSGQVKWEPISTDDDYGLVDIAKQIENYKGSVMYATTTFESASEQEVQFRLGTPNAWKLWVNGELVFAREEYHRGTKMDQYIVPAELKKGKNVILLKVLQNEQTQSWAQRYQFQLRVTDATGTAVRSADAD